MDDVGKDDDFDFMDQDDGLDFFAAEDAVFDPTLPQSADIAVDLAGSGASTNDAAPVIEDVSALFPRAPPKLAPVVVGCVAQAQLAVGVDLRKLSCGARNVEFVPKRSAAATMRLRDPPCVCFIRTSGSISIVGSTSAGAAKEAAELCVRIIRKVLGDERIQSFRFRLRSIMARIVLGHPIRLDGLQREYSDQCAYEPETYCGCIVKLRGPDRDPWAVTCNVYVTGKVTMLGARSHRDLMSAYYTLLPMLAKHAKIQ